MQFVEMFVARGGVGRRQALGTENVTLTVTE
jgi:hypothetical protein